MVPSPESRAGVPRLSCSPWRAGNQLISLEKKNERGSSCIDSAVQIPAACKESARVRTHTGEQQHQKPSGAMAL